MADVIQVQTSTQKRFVKGFRRSVLPAHKKQLNGSAPLHILWLLDVGHCHGPILDKYATRDEQVKKYAAWVNCKHVNCRIGISCIHGIISKYSSIDIKIFDVGGLSCELRKTIIKKHYIKSEGLKARVMADYNLSDELIKVFMEVL